MGEGEGRAHLTLLVTPVRPSAVWRWISAQEIRLSVGMLPSYHPLAVWQWISACEIRLSAGS